ncbi:hypothetical protein [Streptomyces griseoloalbus]|uniref:hypothetical protein n=1 Tax=Streptomyces griseoloalbus TaxID=67303 RepID=UPI00227D757C|nr:hypothetical protein [Streptomyces albaduncus]
MADTVGGYGVAQAVPATLAETDENPVGLTATMQGFGSMGGAAARYLARAGMHVVAVVDRDGVVADLDGLDLETLLAHRSPGAWSTATGCPPVPGRLRARSGWRGPA